MPTGLRAHPPSGAAAAAPPAGAVRGSIVCWGLVLSWGFRWCSLYGLVGYRWRWVSANCMKLAVAGREIRRIRRAISSRVSTIAKILGSSAYGC
jgi:hypothetical protein